MTVKTKKKKVRKAPGAIQVPYLLKAPGGKGYLLPALQQLVPPHLTRVEPYCCSAKLTLSLDPDRNWLLDQDYKSQHGEHEPAHLKGCNEIINDLDGAVINFWKVMQSPELFGQMHNLLNVTPPGEPFYNEALGRLLQQDPAQLDQLSIRRAADFFICCRQSRAAMAYDGFTPLATTRTRSRMNELASAWWHSIEDMPVVHARLKRLVILCRPALEVMRKYDAKTTWFYIDCPYLHETRASDEYYVFEMDTSQHSDLLETCGQLEGKFLLSGYRSVLYDEAAARYHWNRVEVDLANHMAGGGSKKRKMECLWFNYDPPKHCEFPVVVC